MFRILRSIVLALILTLPTAGAAQAAVHGLPGLAAPAGGEGLLAAARDWLLGRLRPATPQPAGKRPATLGKAMCGVDPDGRQTPCR